MARVAVRTLALVAGIGSVVQAQDACRTGGRWTTLGGATAASVGVTALQKSTARRADGFSIAMPRRGLSEWNDVQTPLHVIASHQLARMGARALQGCASGTTAIWRGAAFSAAIGVAKEVVDGYYDGFNPADLVADGAGIGLAVAQAYAPRLEGLAFSFSLTGIGTTRTPNGTRLGAPGHAVWLSASPDQLLPAIVGRRWPAAVRLSAGRRFAQSPTGAPEYVMTLDLDASRLLPVRHGTARALVRGVHLPAPGLIVAPGQRGRLGLVW